jgi:uncharacterized protein (DUF433 family)
MDRITFDDQDPSAPPRIRGLGITVREVYRALHMELGSEEKVLARYPELDHLDLAAVEQYIAKTIRARTHDDITGRLILSKEKLVHGAYYKGRCRNATVARWNADEQCFYHWREKFGGIYIETIKYPTDEQQPWWDTFDVVEELQNQKFEIPFDLEAEFTGNPDDLVEHNEEMWSRVKK